LIGFQYGFPEETGFIKEIHYNDTLSLQEFCKKKQTMKRDKIIYWISTGLVAAAMLLSAFMYLTGNPELLRNFQLLDLPLYLVGMLGMAKLLGAVVLVVPVWNQLKEWSYAGFAFVFIGAVWTHVATGTPWIAPLIFLLILAVSYFFRSRIRG
jgi:hypothetical protein